MPRRGLQSRADSTGSAKLALNKASRYLATAVTVRPPASPLPGEKEIPGFSQAQGTNFHCQPTGRQLTHTQMLDWLAGHLPPQAGKVSELLLASD